MSTEDKTRLGAQLNSYGYIRQCLEVDVMPSAVFVDQYFILMHDNIKAYIARILREYLHDVGATAMQFPARSLDMNIIDHLWGQLKRRV